MTSITQVCLLEDKSHEMSYLTQAMGESLIEWYREYVNMFDAPPGVGNLLDQYLKMRLDQVKEMLVEAGEDELGEVADQYGCYDIEELAMEIVDDEMLHDLSIYNSIIEDAYEKLMLSFLCSEDECGFVFDPKSLGAYPFGDSYILGAQTPIFAISPVSGRAYKIQE